MRGGISHATDHNAGLPERTVMRVSETRLDHLDDVHGFHQENREAARDNWRDEIAANAQLFDGEVLLASAIALEDGVFAAACHLVPYSTFLLWRRQHPVAGAWHVFAMPLIESADGTVIAARMSAATANAGKVYCPSGGMDSQDIFDGRFDPAANMRREIGEETGLDLHDAEAETGYWVVRRGTIVTLFRRYRFASTFEDLSARIMAHAETAKDREIEQVIGLRGVEDLGDDSADHMPAIISWWADAEPKFD